jgi:hypothetical protein
MYDEAAKLCGGILHDYVSKVSLLKIYYYIFTLLCAGFVITMVVPASLSSYKIPSRFSVCFLLVK